MIVASDIKVFRLIDRQSVNSSEAVSPFSADRLNDFRYPLERTLDGAINLQTYKSVETMRRSSIA